MRVFMVLISLFGLFVQPPSTSQQTWNEVKCLRVKDGDTLLVQRGDRPVSLRLAYIDAPELDQLGIDGKPWGRVAKKQLEKLIGPHRLQVQIVGKGYFGRYLAEVFVGNMSLNAYLVAKGLAIIYPRSRFASVHQKFLYWSAYEKAKNKKLGQWSAKKFLNPKHYRRQKKLP